MSIKQTKTVLLSVIVLLTVLIFVQACEKSASKSLIGTIILTDKETKTFTNQGKSITITASDFKESRCPINANCVWQGYSSVKITLKDDVKEQDLVLCLGECGIGGIPALDKVMLNGITFKIKIEEITPYPTLDKIKPEISKVRISFSE